MRESDSYSVPGTIEVIEARPGATVVELPGEHDLADSEKLGSLLESLVRSNLLVVVDLSRSTFIDSSIVLALVRADRLATERGTRFRLQFGTAAIVERALELTGLLDLIETARSREEALLEDDG